MLKLLTCVHGHFWEATPPGTNGEAVADNASLHCPVCGAPADELPLIDLVPSTAESVTPTVPAAPKSPPLLDMAGDPIVAGYDILEPLGKNKKGVLTYRAKQLLINRVVLLKVVLGRDDIGQVSWGALRGEANALGKLCDPGIPQIHDVGERDRQLFYNAVEYFDGVLLSERIKGKPVPPAQVAKFVERVARALHTAHEKGVIHRAIKPAGILVEADPKKPLDQCAFKINDFGLAGRLIEGEVNDVELQEKLPQYLSPEQAWGYAKDIGACSDVYALGVLLYEMLTGRPPYRGERASEIIEQIRSRAPTPPREVNRGVPADLDAICRKCLQKPPRKRYASALELAEDLRRHQDGVPVKARDISPHVRLFKLLVRYPAAGALAVLLFLMFFTTLTAFLVGLSQAEADSYRYQMALSSERTARQDAEAARVKEAQAREREQLAVYYHDLTRAEIALKEGRTNAAENILAASPHALQHWEWHYLWNRTRPGVEQPLVFTPPLDGRPIVAAAVSPDGRLVAAGCGFTPGQNPRGSVYVWNTASLQLVHTLTNDFTGRIHDLAFSPDGKTLAVVSDAPDNKGQLDAYSMPSGMRLYHRPFQSARGTSVLYSPDGKYLVVGGGDGKPWLFNAANGNQTRIGQFGFGGFPWEPKNVRMAFSADSQRLAWCDGNTSEVQVWSCITGDILGTLRGHLAVTSVSFAPDDRIVTGARDGMIKVWDGLYRERHSQTAYNRDVAQVLFSSDGKRLATLGPGPDNKSLVRWYDGASLREIVTVTGLPNAITRIALDKEGKRLVVASPDEVRMYGAPLNR